MVDIEREIMEFRGAFPQIGRHDFYELDNGNVGLIIIINADHSNQDKNSYIYHVEGPNRYNSNEQSSDIPDRFEVLVEFQNSYPSVPPRVWIVEPDILSACPYAGRTDEHGHTEIEYINPNIWGPKTTGHDVAVLVKSWVYAYCHWIVKDEWEWGDIPEDTLPTKVSDKV